MTPIALDDTADTYDTFLVAVLTALYGDRYGVIEADKVSHALDAAGLPGLIEQAADRDTNGIWACRFQRCKKRGVWTFHQPGTNRNYGYCEEHAYVMIPKPSDEHKRTLTDRSDGTEA